MIISILQPCFVPWLGYFEQIALADKFVYLDDVQYNRRNWRNNNQLKSPAGVKEICVSVNKSPFGTPINEIQIAYHLPWKKKLINQLQNWYKKTKYYDEIINLITPQLDSIYPDIATFNHTLNQTILDYLEIETAVYRSSSIPVASNNKVDRIAEICRHFDGITTLFDGKSAQNFLDENSLTKQGIKIVFQNYHHSKYPQMWGEFVPYMSVLDCLFNCGKEAKHHIISEQSRALLALD